jgi:hypothetical protein
MPIYRITLPDHIRPASRFIFHNDFNSTWRITPESLVILNDIINHHPEFPTFVRLLIRAFGIPDIHIRTHYSGTRLDISSGIGPLQKTQILHIGTIQWKGLFNNYNLVVQMDPGISNNFRISGMIPGRGFSEFKYNLNDTGTNLRIDASVPMKEGQEPFIFSISLYSVERHDT